MDHEQENTPPTLADQGLTSHKRLWVKRLILGGVILGLAVASVEVPLPFFYAQLPGPVREVESLVEIEGTQTYSSEGELFLTTVSVDISVTFVEWIAAVIDPDSRILMKEDLVPPGTSLDDLEAQQQQQMDESQQTAIDVAFAALGRSSGDGVRVVKTVALSPASGKLRKDDVVVAVDGQRSETVCDVGAAIDEHSPGESVTLTVRRSGSRLKLPLVTEENPDAPGEPFIGIFMENVNYSNEPGVDVKIKTGRIAGPSAGLMFTLAIYDLLTPEDLTAGRRIAGTGEILQCGDVFPIGGIEQKVAGAEAEGAEIFLAPEANYAAAAEAAGDIEVVSISNFQEAVDYLAGLDR